MKQDQRGLTLVEILGGIVLLSIVTTLTTMILIQIFDTNEKASEKISLRQDMNIAVSQLRSDFYNKDTGKICFNDQEGRLILKAKSRVTNGNGELDSVTGCIDKVSHQNDMELKLYVKNNDGDELDIETTLVKGGESESLVVDNNPDNPCVEDPKIEWKKYETLPCGTINDSIWWTGDKLSSKCDKGNPTLEFKNLKTSKEVELKNINLNVAQSVFFQKQTDFKNAASINVGGNGCFLGQFDAENVNSMTFKGSATFKDESEFKNSDLKIDGNAQFLNEFDMKNGKTKIGQNATFKGEFDLENGSLYVGNDAVFNDQAEFKNSDVTIIGKADFFDQFDISGKKISIGKGANFKGQADFKNADLKVGESVHFEDQFEQDNGTINIQLNAIFEDQADFKNTIGAINGDIYFMDETDLENSSLNIAGDLVSSKSDIELKNSLLKVHGKGSFVQNVKLANSKLCVRNGISGINQQSSPGCMY